MSSDICFTPHFEDGATLNGRIALESIIWTLGLQLNAKLPSDKGLLVNDEVEGQEDAYIATLKECITQARAIGQGLEGP